jgi:hypothetical protein
MEFALNGLFLSLRGTTHHFTLTHSEYAVREKKWLQSFLNLFFDETIYSLSGQYGAMW